MPTCFLCKETVHSVNSLLTHFNVKYYVNSFTIYKCGENGCIREWSMEFVTKTFAWIKSHSSMASYYKACLCVQFTNTEMIIKSVIHHNNMNIYETFSLEDTINKDLSVTPIEFKSLVKKLNLSL